MEEHLDNSQRFINFRLLYLMTQMIGVSLIILVTSWIGMHLNGFGWSYNEPSIMFNWHPLLMVIGMVYLYGNSILIYRGFRYVNKYVLKVMHAVIHGTTLLFTITALVAVFNSHNYASPPIGNLYSLHSWIGILAVVIFAMQYVIGFVFFLYPAVDEQLRKKMMPIHLNVGLFAFILGWIASLMGLSEKAFFHMDNTYSNLPNEAILVNVIGLLIITFGTLVIYLVTKSEYKREPLPEDSMLLRGYQE